MTTPVEQLSYKPSSATGGVARRLDERTIEMALSVKDFGAVGDGLTDDTAAVQACFDAAFGPYSNPHSLTGLPSKSVFFPAGSYIVRPPNAAVNISSVVINATTGCRVNTSTNHNLTSGDMVYVRGVIGVPNANGAYSCVVNSPTQIDLFANGNTNSPTFTGAYVSGGTVCRAALQIKGIDGEAIFGEGKNISILFCDTTGSIALSVNGMRHASVRDMNFIQSDRGIAFDCNWDGSNVGGASQQVLFDNCEFGQGPSGYNDYSFTMGFALMQNDAATFLNPNVGMGRRAGICVINQNSIGHQVFGGNFQGVQSFKACSMTSATPTVATVTQHNYDIGDAVRFTTDPEFVPPGGGTIPTGVSEDATYFVANDGNYTINTFSFSDTRDHALAGTNQIATSDTGTQPYGSSLQSGPGVWVTGGTFPTYVGVLFENFHGPDIRIDGVQNDAYFFSGCRTESHRFLYLPGPIGAVIAGCAMSSGYGGPQNQGYAFFADGAGGNWVFSGCWDAGGHAINNSGGNVTIENCHFDADVLKNGSYGANPGKANYLRVDPKTTREITDATYTLDSWDPAYKMLFNRGTGQTITVDTNVNKLYGPGTIIEVQQMGAGKTTFINAGGVTINSRGGLLSLNGQYAVGFLRCDAVNSWTFYGDIGP